MKNRWFRNKKNGKPYKVIDAAINATNGRENEKPRGIHRWGVPVR